MLGKPLRFDLPSDKGDRIFIPVRRASVTIVSFWSPRCKACRNWVAELVRRRPDMEAKQAQLVLVAVLGEGESTEQAKNKLSDWGVSSSFVVDAGAVAQREASILELPGTLILDEQGLVRWVAPAEATSDDVLAASH